GDGGAAGGGGPGGRSHSWTTSSSYTDSQGNSRTRTHHHSNPGGSRGRSGTRGARSRLPLVAGADGGDGEIEYWVHDGEESAVYSDRYRPRLMGFAHVSANEDGVYEPLERIEVSGLTVTNEGGMPTPRDHDVTLSLESRGWVWPEEDASLLLPRSLGPGETASIPGSLFFSVGDQVPEGPSDPLGIVDYIVHRAEVPAVERTFAGYHDRVDDPLGRFVVRHPVALTSIEALPSLAPGEATRVRFTLENVSGRALGEASPQRRVVRFRLRPQGSALGEVCVLFDGDGRPLPHREGWVEAVPSLDGESTVSFEATLALTDVAPLYERATYWLSLELAPPTSDDGPAPPRVVQHRAFEVTAAARYRRVPDCELLLVTNHHTTRAQMEAWMRLAERAGLPMAVWDVSLEGHLDLAREEGGAPLLEHIRGGTVVVLDAPRTSPLAPHRLLHRAEVQQLVEASVSVLIFGGEEGEVPIERWMVPVKGDADPSQHHESPLAFRSALSELEGAGDAPVHESLDVHHVGLWFEAPDSTLIEERASRLATHLADEYPHRRFVLDTRYEPELDKKYGLMRRWKVGTIEVRSTLAAARSQVVHAPAAPDAAALDDGDAEGLVRIARDFDRKLGELQEALTTGRDALPDVEAILVDLAMEQSSILARGGGRRGLSKADMARSLPMLDALVAHSESLPAIALDDWRAGVLVELAARLTYLTRAQPRWWEWALYPLRRAPMLRTATTRRIDVWVEGTFAQNADEARERIAARVDEIEESREAESDAAADPRDHARTLLRGPLERGATSLAELEIDTRVIDTEEREKLLAADEEDRRRRASAAQRRADTRARLLRRLDSSGALAD
ncbi:MAG: hypothetical protein AB8I08_34045, partial [Sandaracinaceae bacterium]